MDDYKGPAVIALDNGRELPVTANLRQSVAGPGRTDWSGTLSVPSNSQPIELTNLAGGRLRIDGREGSFVRPDISDWLGSPAGRFQITIEGSGDAPF